MNYSEPYDTEESPLIGPSTTESTCGERYRKVREKYRLQFSGTWFLFLAVVGAITFFVNYGKANDVPGCTSSRSRTSALLLSFFFGIVGADRFYLGYPLIGAIKVITSGVAGIWWVIDLVLIFMGVLIDSDGCTLQ